ncbi:hypothetical protein [Streptomyces microflavus]
MRSIRGLGRRTKAAGGALVLTLTAGGLIWGFGLRGDGSGQSPADTCRGALAVEEAPPPGQTRQVPRRGHVVPVGIETAKAAGILCGKAGTSDIVDATVVTMTASRGAIIWTSDPDDIRTLIDAQDIKPAPVIRTV